MHLNKVCKENNYKKNDYLLEYLFNLISITLLEGVFFLKVVKVKHYNKRNTESNYLKFYQYVAKAMKISMK